MIKLKSCISILVVLLLAKTLDAQQSFSKKKVDSLLHLTQVFSDEDKVILYQKLAKLYEKRNNDSVFFYANLAYEAAKRDQSDLSYSEANFSIGDAYSDKQDYPQALTFYIKAKEYCEKGNGKPLQISILSTLGSTYRNLKRYSEAIESYKQSIEVCREINDYKNEARVLYHIANIYYDINDFNKALEFAIKSANIGSNHQIELELANTYNFIGYIHNTLKNNDLSQEYFEKAYSLYVKSKDIKGLSMTLNNLGIIYYDNNEKQKAIENYAQSLEYAKQLKDDDGIATAMNNIGMIYVELGQFDKGLDYYFQSLNHSIKIFDKLGYTNTYNNIASAYLKAGNLEKAEEYVIKNLPLAKKVTDLAIAQESYQILSKIYAQKGQYDKAFKNQAIQLAYNDSLYLQQKTSSILEMQTRFETEAKEKEIQLLKKDNEINALEVERHKNTQKYLFISSLLLLILVIVILNSLRVKRNSNILLSQKNDEFETSNEKLKKSEQDLMELNATKDKFFSIIAHDLKNPFNALFGFSELLEKNYTTYSDEERREYINVIYESSQSLSKLLDNLLQWSRTQTGSITYNPEVFEVKPIILQEVSYLQVSADKKKITILTSVDESLSAFADKNIISLVVRNLVNNAIKFTNTNGKIDISARETKNNIEISVTDSGIGIDNDDLDKIFNLSSSISNKGTANEEGTGLGLLLCKEFVEMNKGGIWATSVKGKGSTFTFSLPKNVIIS